MLHLLQRQRKQDKMSLKASPALEDSPVANSPSIFLFYGLKELGFCFWVSLCPIIKRERERTWRSLPCLPCSWRLIMWLGSDQWDRGRAPGAGAALPLPLLPSSCCSLTSAMLQEAAAILPAWGGSRKRGRGWAGRGVTLQSRLSSPCRGGQFSLPPFRVCWSV